MNNLKFKDLNDNNIDNDIIIKKIKEYKSKNNRKIEEKIIKEQLKTGILEFFNSEKQKWEEADIANISELVNLFKKEFKTKNIEKNKKDKNIKNKILEFESGESSGNFRAILNVNYNDFINNLKLSWESIIWERDSKDDLRNYSFIIKELNSNLKWTIYDWDSLKYKNQWLISGESSEKELNEILAFLESENVKMQKQMHSKDPERIFKDIGIDSKKKENKKEVKVEKKIKEIYEEKKKEELNLDEFESENENENVM